VAGQVLQYRGQSYDFSPLPEGAEIEVGSPFIGAVTRKNGVIQATLEYKYNWDTSESYQPTNWDDYTFVVTDGACPCPIKRKPEPEVFDRDEALDPLPTTQTPNVPNEIEGSTALEQEIDHITIKSQPFSHGRVRDFLDSCLHLGVKVQWTEGNTLTDRIWLITGEPGELAKLNAHYQEMQLLGVL
jgi:hypothetical protein